MDRNHRRIEITEGEEVQEGGAVYNRPNEGLKTYCAAEDIMGRGQ